ncbi:MAG: hypothetical protein ACLFR1_06915 [Spirochaetia bacterium]
MNRITKSLDKVKYILLMIVVSANTFSEELLLEIEGEGPVGAVVFGLVCAYGGAKCLIPLVEDTFGVRLNWWQKSLVIGAGTGCGSVVGWFIPDAVLGAYAEEFLSAVMAGVGEGVGNQIADELEDL